MDVLTFKKWWAVNSEIIKTSDIKLVYLYSTIKMMHGTINLRFSFGFCIFELTFPFSLNVSLDVCLASPRIGADNGCTFLWVICIILYKSQPPMFSYCISLCLYSAYARHKFCMADYLAYCNKYFVSAMFSYHYIVNLRGAMFESLCYDCRATAVMCW